MRKLPFMQFYPGDWMKDPALRSCSPATRGIWMDMLCLMHESPRRGYLQHGNGNPVTAAQLARMTGCTTDEISSALSELETAEVYSRTKDGVIFSRRISADEQKRQLCSAAGKNGGGNPTFGTKNKGATKGRTKVPLNSHISETELERELAIASSPPLPPAGAGGGGRAGSEWEHCADHPAITDGDSCPLDGPPRSPGESDGYRPPHTPPKPLARPPEFSAVMSSAWSPGGAASYITTFYPPSRSSGAKRATIAAINALAVERFDGQWERAAVWLLGRVQTYAASPWVQSHFRQCAEQFLPFLKTWMESCGYDDPPATWQAERRGDGSEAKKGPDMDALRKHLEGAA